MPSDASQAHIQLSDVCIEYPFSLPSIRSPGGKTKHRALEKISFELVPGNRLGLLGRNGSGKSTLLKTLAGVYPPVSGELKVSGSVAAIFNASLGFIKDATGRENIYLRGAMMGMTVPEVDELVPGIIEFSELGDWIERPISEYSSGMALRLAFSITTAKQSDILLLDEWLGAGDGGFLEKARKRMQSMVEESRIMVLATHNMALMRSQCDMALLIDDGKPIFFGDLEEAIEQYNSLRRLTKI